MYAIEVHRFGGPEVLELVESPTPEPGPGEVVIRLGSIGMNHADLMQRDGRYKASSGEPPFSPGLEGGGVIEAVGPDVSIRAVGDRVSLGLGLPVSLKCGPYRSHYLCRAEQAVLVPAGVPDHMLGAMWLAYLTAWGCLIWRQQLSVGQHVLIPAASSAVGIAAAQVVKRHGGIAIGTTTSPDKLERLASMAEAPFDHLFCSQDAAWSKKVKACTDGRGVDVIFDPVAAGDFLSKEIRLLAPGGTLWIYGLLGEPGVVDVTPLIIKQAAMRGWLNNELTENTTALAAGYEHVMSHLADGRYRMPVAATFALRDVRSAHTALMAGRHIGKMILVPEHV